MRQCLLCVCLVCGCSDPSRSLLGPGYPSPRWLWVLGSPLTFSKSLAQNELARGGPAVWNTQVQILLKHGPTGWPWASLFASVSLSFLFYKMGTIIVPTSQAYRKVQCVRFCSGPIFHSTILSPNFLHCKMGLLFRVGCRDQMRSPLKHSRDGSCYLGGFSPWHWGVSCQLC